MKKMFNIFLASVIAFFTIPLTGFTVSADDGTKLNDGIYEIDYTVYHEDVDVNSFFNKPATLKVENGRQYIQLQYTATNYIVSLSLPSGDVDVIGEDNENQTRTVGFEVNGSLLNPIMLELKMSYGMTHEVQVTFDLDSLTFISEIENSESSEDDESSEEGDNDREEDGSENESDGNTGAEDGSENESDGDSNGEGTETPGEETDNENDLIADGTYTIDVSYLHTDKEEPSTMARYLDDTAFVTVKDGKAEVTITVNDHGTVTKLLVDNKKSIVAKLDGNKRYETFHVESLESVSNAYVEYQAPLPGRIHYGKADFRIVFDVESIQKVSANNQPGIDIEEVLLNLDEGYYTIGTSYIRADNNDSSSMGRYLGENTFVSIEEGKVFVTITVNDKDTVTKLQVNGRDSVEKIVDGDKRYETFEIENLVSLLNAYVEYQAPYNGDIHYGKADFRISLDENAVKSAKASDKPGANVEEPKEPEEPKENPKENPKKPIQKPKVPIIDNKLVPDKVYEINYMIKHENGVNTSVADEFFEKPGYLLEKDGKTYLQVTINNGDMIKELSNKYGDALLLKKQDNGSIVVQLRVDNDLSDMLLNMRIDAGIYNETHNALLVFDKKSMTEIPIGDFILGGTDDPNIKNAPFVKDGTPNKPTFGNGANGNSEQNGVAPVKKSSNPQTGDTSKIVFLTVLLLASLIPLGIQLRRRFV